LAIAPNPHPPLRGDLPRRPGEVFELKRIRPVIMLSIVMPAHNEERFVGSAVAAAVRSAKETGLPFEVIVVDDSSTDRTPAIGAEQGARVIHIERRQIAAARNAGAAVAKGDILFFIDADTLANPDAIRACLRALRLGAVGGGCVFTFDGVLPPWARALYPWAVLGARVFKLLGGCFLYCTKNAFDAVGGFDERYFAAEELIFIRALKRIGPVVVPRPTVVTSGRKLRAFSALRILGEAKRWIRGGAGAFQQREGLDIWYGERAE
jgi:glycosyltransferase involved in cell wall biosynthesis